MALPRMVKVYAPGTAVANAVTVSVVWVVPLVTWAGLNTAMTPAGTDSVERSTVPVKLPVRAIVAVIEALPPTTALSVADDNETVKPAGVGVGVVPPLSPPPQAATNATARTEQRRDACGKFNGTSWRTRCDLNAQGGASPNG